MSAILEYPQKHPISAEEYLRMGEAGVFPPDARLELIDGEIIEMAPIGSPYAGCVKKLMELFVRRGADRAIVSVQDPAVISDRSVPQPDVALLKRRSDYYSRSHPTAPEVLLVVEVADTTLAFDLGKKARVYALAGIREVWVIDVNARAIHVLRDPVEGTYRTVFIAREGQTVASVALPEVLVEVGEVFPA